MDLQHQNSAYEYRRGTKHISLCDVIQAQKEEGKGDCNDLENKGHIFLQTSVPSPSH